MNSLYLSEADRSRLESIHQLIAPPPRASHEQRLALEELLKSAKISKDKAVLNRSVGFGDEVVLISPSDPTDDFPLTIVMPHEADPAEGLISIFAPVSLSLLGRAKGDTIAWDANGVIREMRVSELRKNKNEASVSLST